MHSIMENSGLWMAGFLVVLALADRFIVRRQGLVFERIGGVTHDKVRGAYVFECTFRNKSIIKLRGAKVSYYIFDDSDPSNILSGKEISLNSLKKGEQNVNLLISDKYVVPGRWDIVAEMTYGNCIWNPLYRLFPYRTTLKKQHKLSKD